MERFRYDGAGNRIEKRVERYDTTMITRYIRDASGNVMAIYSDTHVMEMRIYGSNRLSRYRGEVAAGVQMLGRRDYELSNHLGNVLTVITDNISMDTPDSTCANVVSTSDYYPFGLEMQGRSWRDSTLLENRYGFNGKEKDDNGEFGSTTYDYGSRIYNPAIGKFLSVDPLTKSFPWNSPYAFAENSVIRFVDLEGLEQGDYFVKQFVDENGETALKVISFLDNGPDAPNRLFVLDPNADKNTKDRFGYNGNFYEQQYISLKSGFYSDEDFIDKRSRSNTSQAEDDQRDYIYKAGDYSNKNLFQRLYEVNADDQNYIDAVQQATRIGRVTKKLGAGNGGKKPQDAGKNSKHGDGGRALTKAEKQIKQLEEQMQGAPRKLQEVIQRKIKNIRETAEKKAKGEEHLKDNKR